MLHYKGFNNTIYPHGSWIGVYFTEEMKALMNYGYKFKLIRGYEFNKIDLFSRYVNYFFDIKRNSNGSTKFIAKMHLNQLYGIFGRRLDLLESIIINDKDLYKYLTSKVIKNMIKIDDDKWSLLIRSNIDNNILNELNNYFESDFTSNIYNVKSKVVLATAITSYARIHMIPFKMDNNVYYTDTDSIFTDSPLDPKYIGDGLGLMKDELNGAIIEKAYFLGIKQYGYIYKKDDNIIEKSTFAGVPKNGLSFEEIIKIHNGGIVNKILPNRFYKFLKDLSIVIKSNINVVLQRSNKKTLLNNDNIPLEVNQNMSNTINLFEKIKIQIIKFYNLIFTLYYIVILISIKINYKSKPSPRHSKGGRYKFIFFYFKSSMSKC